MKSTKYSDKVLDHFRNPRNVGTLEGDDVVVGKVGNPTCGDIMEVFIRIDGEKITEAKFRTFGCGSAIATTSMTTEMVVGMTLDEAWAKGPVAYRTIAMPEFPNLFMIQGPNAPVGNFSLISTAE